MKSDENGWNIKSIEQLTEEEAKQMAIESAQIKDHNIYFVDFGGYFGYSYLVFKADHHIHYVNDYELHHSGKTKEELRGIYYRSIRNKLFTEEEIAGQLKDYVEYDRKSKFLRDYYGMQRDNVSIFSIGEKEKWLSASKSMTYNPCAFAYYDDVEFVNHHINLCAQLEKAKDSMIDNYEYWKGAFVYEMFNHEYAINWQADFDTLSAFGDISYQGEGGLLKYFDDLGFNDTQRSAYIDARKQYYNECYEKGYI